MINKKVVSKTKSILTNLTNLTNLTKTQKTNICSKILNDTYNSGSKVVDKPSADFLIKNIFSNHLRWKNKVGVGIDHIEVGPNGYGGKCFFIVRIDGSSTDISYVKSITPEKPIDYVYRACRTAIRPIIKKEREKIELPFVCPITNEIIYNIDDIHIDHYDLTFDEVFNEWIKDKDINELFNKTLDSSKDNSTITYFDDKEIIKDFVEFHNNHTHLRAVSKKANLGELRKKRK